MHLTRILNFFLVMMWCTRQLTIMWRYKHGIGSMLQHNSYRWLSGKLCYLQHNCAGNTIEYHLESEMLCCSSTHGHIHAYWRSMIHEVATCLFRNEYSPKRHKNIMESEAQYRKAKYIKHNDSAVSMFECVNYSFKAIPLHLTLNVRGPSYLGLTRSISWLLMPWLLTSPGHQQPWYWLCRIGGFLSYLRKDLNYLRRTNVEKWHKM